MDAPITQKWILFCLLSIFFTNNPAIAGPSGDLRRAAKDGDLESVEQLIDEVDDADVLSRKGNTPLIHASKRGYTEIVQLLLYHGADPHLTNDNGRSAVHVAERNEQYHILDLLKNTILEQELKTGVSDMKPVEFISLMTGVLKGRKWKIEFTGSNNIVARYRRGRDYKVETTLNNKQISIRFLRGYGASNSRYLRNLRKDLEKKLKANKSD